MTDTQTQRPIRVSTDGTSGPYIMLPRNLLERVLTVLRTHAIPFWVDHIAVSIDGKPALTVINLGKRVDPQRIQTLLDEAE
jgi:hypothetical protein